MAVANASGTISHLPVATAAGTYETFVARFAFFSSGAPTGCGHPWRQWPHMVQPSTCG
jgi:hypothetical protein